MMYRVYSEQAGKGVAVKPEDGDGAFRNAITAFEGFLKYAETTPVSDGENAAGLRKEALAEANYRIGRLYIETGHDSKDLMKKKTVNFVNGVSLLKERGVFGLEIKN